MGKRGNRWACGKDGASRRLLAALVLGAAAVLVLAAPGGAAGSPRPTADRHGHGSGNQVGSLGAGQGGQQGPGVGHHREHRSDGTGGSSSSTSSSGGVSAADSVSAAQVPVTVPAVTLAPPPSAPPPATAAAARSAVVRARAARAAGLGVGPLAAVPPSPQVASTPPSQILPLPSPKGGVGRALQTAQASTLLLGLAAAVVIFLGVQGRLDRRDPRLARAPIEERLDFEDVA